MVIALVLGNSKSAVKIQNVDSAGLIAAQKKGATLLDVRTGVEYMDGHIAGAVLVEEGTYASALADATRDDAYIVYCRTGNRSSEVVNWMKANGFKNIYHLDRGIVSWTGELVPGIEPGTPDFDIEVAPEPQAPQQGQANPDVSDIELIAPVDGKPVLVQFSTTT